MKDKIKTISNNAVTTIVVHKNINIFYFFSFLIKCARFELSLILTDSVNIIIGLIGVWLVGGKIWEIQKTKNNEEIGVG